MALRDFAWGSAVGICVSLIVWAACSMLADPYLRSGEMAPAIPWRAVELAEAQRIRADMAERQRDDWKRRHDMVHDSWQQAAWRATDYAGRYDALLLSGIGYALQSQYNNLIQTNQSAAQLYRTYQATIGDIYSNPNVTPEQAGIAVSVRLAI